MQRRNWFSVASASLIMNFLPFVLMLVFVAGFDHLMPSNSANWTNGVTEGWSYVLFSAAVALWQGVALKRRGASLEASLVAALLVQPLHGLMHGVLPGKAHISELLITDFRIFYPFLLATAVFLGHHFSSWFRRQAQDVSRPKAQKG